MPRPPAVSPSAHRQTSFTCTSSSGLGVEWIRLAGELDLSCVDVLAEPLTKALASAYLIAVDLRELQFIDCAALRILVAAAADARRTARSLVLVRGHGQVDRMMQSTGLLGHLEWIELSPGTSASPIAADGSSSLPSAGRPAEGARARRRFPGRGALGPSREA